MKIDELINKYLDEIGSVRRYADNTIKSYKTDLDEFYNYCKDQDRVEISKITERFLKSYLMVLSEKN